MVGGMHRQALQSLTEVEMHSLGQIQNTDHAFRTLSRA